jgi:hypothetical protein
MRFGLCSVLLAAVAGCSGYSTPSAPSKPSEPSMPAKPSAPAKPDEAMMKPPSKPSAEAPKSAELPRAEKPADLPKPAAAPIDKTPVKGDLSKIKFKAEPAELFGYDEGESRAFFYSNGLGEVTVKVPADGDYEIVISASCQAAKGENAKFKLKVDGVQVGAETQLKSEDAKDYAFTTALKSGDRAIGAEFTNDTYKEGEYDLNFFLNGVKVVRVK